MLNCCNQLLTLTSRQCQNAKTIFEISFFWKHQCFCFHNWDYLTNFLHNNWQSIIDVIERLGLCFQKKVALKPQDSLFAPSKLLCTAGLVSPSIPRKAHKTLNHHVRQSVVSWGQRSWNSVLTCSNEVLIFCFASFSFPPFFSFLAHGSLGSRDAKEKPSYTLYSFWSDILASRTIYVPFW